METILGVLDIMLTNKLDDRYVGYLTKTIDNSIEYVDPIEVIVIPKRLYVHAPNHPHGKLLGSLIEAITLKYTKRDIPNSKNNSVGHIVETADSLEVFAVTATICKESKTLEINVSEHYKLEIIITDEPTEKINEVCLRLD